MLSWLCLNCTCGGAFESSEFRRQITVDAHTQKKSNCSAPVQARPVDISPSEDDPQVDTASCVDAAVVLSQLLVQCLRTWRISMTKKQWTRSHGKNPIAVPLCKPFPWIFRRVKTIPKSTPRHAWMLPWLCLNCSCCAFERGEFRRQKNSGHSRTEKIQLQCPCAHPFRGYCAE